MKTRQALEARQRKLLISLVFCCVALLAAERFGWFGMESGPPQPVEPYAFVRVFLEEPVGMRVSLDATQFDAIELQHALLETPVAVSLRMNAAYRIHLAAVDARQVPLETYKLEIHTGQFTDDLAGLLQDIVVPVKLTKEDLQQVVSGVPRRMLYYLASSSDTSAATDSRTVPRSKQPTAVRSRTLLAEVRVLPDTTESDSPVGQPPEFVERWIAVDSD